MEHLKRAIGKRLSGNFGVVCVEEGEHSVAGRPGETFLQNDLDRAIEYRRDYYRYTLSVATALLAFTISFPPKLSQKPDQAWLLILGWIGLGVAVVAGVRVHLVWSHFFMTFRDYDNKGQRDTGKRKRGALITEQKLMDYLQIFGLMIGILGVVAFAGLNFRHIAVAT